MAQFRSIARWGLSIVLLTGTTMLCAQDNSAGERYAKILADAESLARYNQQLSGQVASQQSQAAELEKQLVEMDATGAEVPALIQKMFKSLEAFVANDLPFLDPTQAGPDSRKERLDRLRALMAEASTTEAAASAAEPSQGGTDADQSVADSGVITSDSDPTAAIAKQAEDLAKQHAKNAERYRRLLEAYQIELDYGRTLVAYSGKLTDGREANFVRIGRVSLMYRTVDGEEAGYWDAEQKQWVVANEYNKAIENAVMIATKELAPDLVMVPVPAPQEVPL